MHIVFRADASLTIGHGHVMRCASLAQALRAQGADCSFVCASHAGHLNTYLRDQGFDVRALDHTLSDARHNAESLLPNWQDDARATIDAIQHLSVDWLVVDHYGLDQAWEMALSPHVSQLMVIDDLANRAHHCDLLLDANPGRLANDYASLTPPECRVLAGPQYALIRHEISQSRTDTPRVRHEHAPLKVLVTLGGVDKNNVTSQVLSALHQFDSDAPLDIQVVMGLHAPWLTQVSEMAHSMRWPTQVAHNPSHFVELMCTHDIAIGAAGTSALERCCLGLPSINLVLAANQRLSAQALHANYASGLVELQDGWENALHQQLRALQQDEPRQAMHIACSHITDGAGTARVAREMLHA